MNKLEYGKNKKIVTVVTYYYYQCSKGQIGRDFEFIDKPPVNGIWVKDCEPDNYTEETFKKDFENLTKTKVPLNKGTLVVFCNY